MGFCEFELVVLGDELAEAAEGGLFDGDELPLALPVALEDFVEAVADAAGDVDGGEELGAALGEEGESRGAGLRNAGLLDEPSRGEDRLTK